MTWILQTRAFQDGNPEKFEEILKDKKIPYTWVQVAPFNGGWNYVTKSGPKLCPKYEVYYPFPFIDALDKYFFYGTIEGFKQCGNLFQPNWCKFEQLKYSKYSLKYRPHMLNPPMEGQFRTTMFFAKNNIEHTFGKWQEKFLRPDDNEKSFDGEMVAKEKLQSWYEDTYKYNGNTKITCWCFRPRKIYQEWRVIVANGRFVTASQYRLNGSVELENGCPKAIEDFSEELAKIYSPEPVFCLDIAKTDKGLKLVEIGSIHTCGLYECDLEPIVDVVEKELNVQIV